MTNSTVKRMLDGDIGHAYIISGDTDTARQSLADDITRRLMCVSGERVACLSCSHCVKLEKQIHPDVFVLTPLEGKREISVAQMREMIASTHITPNDADGKVYVIHPADTLNPSAQNAFLKTLEEPPGNCTFLLLTENPLGLLPTIRSRCVLLELSPQEQNDGQVFSEEAEELILRYEKARKSDGMALVEFTMQLEKLERTVFTEFIAAAHQYFAQALLQKQDKQHMALVNLFDGLQTDLRFNVSTGHMAGKIAVISKSFRIESRKQWNKK